MEDLIKNLESRFREHMERHQGLDWAAVETRLRAKPEKMKVLFKMEQTGGEPDVVWQDKKTEEIIFYDCSPESPLGRRNVCYDQKALEARKKFPPKSSAEKMAAEIGVKILTETEYRQLQSLGEFDVKTSSWLKTPDEIRILGGALYGDRRYDHVFVYHNGADSYYASRGFRGQLRV